MSESIEELKQKIKFYEQDGAAKLFYAINRKMNELASLLNKQNLHSLDISDAKDKSFERLKIAWNEAAAMATAAKNLESVTTITGDETKDTNIPKYRITTPESISDVLGNTAGKIN